MPFDKRGGFHEDITTSLAKELFPELAGAAAGANAVYLKDSTPLQHLQRRDYSSRGQALPQNLTGSSLSVGGSPMALDQPIHPAVNIATQVPVAEKKQSHPVLFISVDTGRNQSVAVAVNRGEDDKDTINNMRAAIKKLPSARWKWATGVQFYRVRRLERLRYLEESIL